MGILIECQQGAPPPWWDELLLASPGGHYYQCTAYAAFLRAYQGIRPAFWWATDKGAVTAMLLTREPGWRLGQLHRRRLQWECGPVMLQPSVAEEATVTLLRTVAAHARRRMLFATGPATTAHHAEDQTVAAADRAFAAAGYRQTPGATYLIDGRAGTEACWEALTPAARKSVRKAQRNGVEVRAVPPGPDTEAVIVVYNECRRRQGLSTLGPSYGGSLNRVFGDRMVRFLVAYHEGFAVALLGVIVFGRVMLEFMAGQSEKDIQESLGANDLIRWHAIEHAVRCGALYDQSGVSPSPRTPKEEGIRRFKAKWGGRYLTYAIWSRPTVALVGG